MSRRRIRVVAAMLEREPGRYLITQRAATASLPLLWEFPGGRAQDGEDDQTALTRELKERLGLEVTVDERALITHHEYETYDVDFCLLHCRLVDPTQQVSHQRVNDHRWAALDELAELEFPAADARTLARLLDLEA